MNNMHLQVRSKVLSSFVIRIPRNGAIGRRRVKYKNIHNIDKKTMH